VVNHRHETGLDSITANQPGLPHVSAPGPHSSPPSSPDPRGLGLVIKYLIIMISSCKITALFEAIASVRPCTFESGLPGSKARPMFIPVDGLRIYSVAQRSGRKRPPLISRWHCSWKEVFYSSMLVHIIYAYDFVRMIS